MKKKILITELEGYKKADEKIKTHKLIKEGMGFEISKIQNEMMAGYIEKYIYEKGARLSPLSMRTEIYPFNQLCLFLNEYYKNLDSFENVDIDEMEKKAKVWLIKNGKKITQKKNRLTSKDVTITDAELIKYIKKIYKYATSKNSGFDINDDIWEIETIPLALRINPTKTVKTISFKKISQEQIKKEVKHTIYHLLSTSALGTVLAELTAINRFSSFLENKYPYVESLTEIDRELIERYLQYINSEATGRKSYGKELYHLKKILTTAGKILEKEDLEYVFYEDDIANDQQFLYRVYSDEEIKRLNAAIVNADPQVARVLILHQLIGTRISETLTLKRDSLYKTENGIWMIRIDQIKTGRSYTKAVNEDVKQLFMKSCEWTTAIHGETEYVFVCDKEPSKPMQYSRLQYQLMMIIAKNKLVDDTGEAFGVGTHIWRHCYGKRLTELHVDDITIARLLGHSNTSSLQNYRKIGNKMMAEETHDMRSGMSDLLENIIEGWN